MSFYIDTSVLALDDGPQFGCEHAMLTHADLLSPAGTVHMCFEVTNAHCMRMLQFPCALGSWH